MNPIDVVRNKLFLPPLIGNPLPGYKNLVINRTPYDPVIPADPNNMEAMLLKGQRRVLIDGFQTIPIHGNAQQTLYEAISVALSGRQDDYLNIFNIAVNKLKENPEGYEKYRMEEKQYLAYLEMIEDMGYIGHKDMDPHPFLLAAADAMSVRFIVYDAINKYPAVVFSPPPGTQIIMTAYVLCVPDIQSTQCAYALQTIPKMFRGNEEQTNTSEDVRKDRNWRKHTRLKPRSDKWKMKKIANLKQMPNFADLRCMFKKDPNE